MTIEYVDGRPVRVDTVVISTQHADDIDLDTLLAPDIREHVVEPELAKLAIETEGYRLLVNPTGKFVIGGPMGDASLTGRKIIVDTLRRLRPARRRRLLRQGPVEGGPLGGLRHALGGQERRRGQAGHALRGSGGVRDRQGASRSACSSRPFGTETAPIDRIEDAILQTFDLRPAAIIRDLDLKRPIYAQTAAYGHFGRDLPDFTWERTDRAEQLANARQPAERTAAVRSVGVSEYR